MQSSKINSELLNTVGEKIREGEGFGFRKSDLPEMSKGMQSLICHQIDGNNVYELINEQKQFLKKLEAMSRDECTAESLCFQLSASDQLLFSEYKSIKEGFDTFRKLNKIWVHDGVVLDRQLDANLKLLLIYFQGRNDFTSASKTSQMGLTDLDIPNFLRPSGH